MLTLLLPTKARSMACLLALAAAFVLGSACQTTADRGDPEKNSSQDTSDDGGDQASDTRSTCFFLSETQREETVEGIGTHRDEGASKDDELDRIVDVCRETPPDASFTVGECFDCFMELVEEVYE